MVADSLSQEAQEDKTAPAISEPLTLYAQRLVAPDSIGNLPLLIGASNRA